VHIFINYNLLQSTVGQFFKKLQKLIILAPMHIFLFPIQGKGKIARGIRIWTEKFEKSLTGELYLILVLLNF
jgi:hypothetical protein